ncbi:BnaA09g13460D [Brassica napus]|uniref:BnaA09g13460D protein n=1 Tax=Brassica napus TaxID=3708 RepID=A0A078FL65_BRANA|nr:BnaA09g13460D [Brassica napus]
MASSRFEDSNYAKKLFRLSSLFYGARRRLSFFLTRVDNDSRGGIQLSDYRMGALIDTVDNHEGPVCSHSIAFLLLKRVLLQIIYILFNLKLGREANTILALQASWTWPEVECEIRGNSVYMGRRAFERHFKKNVGPQKLKEALGALGLKVGGTLQQHAERLFLTKDYNCSSQCFRFCWRSPIHDDSSLYILELANKEICSTSSTKYGGVKKIASVTVSELNAYALNASSSVTYYGQKLKETDIAIGSGEIPVNPTPLLNETTTAAQTTLMKA